MLLSSIPIKAQLSGLAVGPTSCVPASGEAIIKTEPSDDDNDLTDDGMGGGGGCGFQDHDQQTLGNVSHLFKSMFWQGLLYF